MKTVKPGIRLKPNGKYFVTKSINGQRYYEEFNTLREAQKWKNEFHPLVKPEVGPVTMTPTVSAQSNGRDQLVTFKEILKGYKDGKLKTLSTQKQYKKELRMDRFLPPIFSVRMCEMRPEIITRLLEDHKLVSTNTFGRCNFDEELKDLRSVFNWYKDERDFTFNSPVMKYHSKIGRIKDVPKRELCMSIEEILAFIDQLKEPFKTMAICQFCSALRIGEVAALNIYTVNLKKMVMDINEVITWVKGKPILKSGTKTGENTSVEINEAMAIGLSDLDKQRPKKCRFFFQVNGEPMRYEWILDAYNKAFKDAELPYSGTHVLRHSQATLTRRKHGMDACQAILRHTTSRMSEHYAKLDVNEKASRVVIEAGEIFLRGRASNASKTDENVKILSS